MTVRTLLPRRARACRFVGAARRRDDELIGREHQLARRSDRSRRQRGRADRRRRSASDSAAASGVSASTTSHDSVDATSVTGIAGREIGAEVAGAPERPH